MEEEFNISLYLDSRRPRKDGKYPLKIRIYSHIEKKTKYYPTKKFFKKEEYDSLFQKKPPKALAFDHDFIRAVETRANNIARRISPFNFKIFESNYYSNRVEKTNLISFYEKNIEKMISDDKIGNAQFYKSSLNAIKKFISEENSEKVKTLHIMSIDEQWLKKFEKYMVEKKKLSISTVGTYLRPLRAIYNIALEENPMYKNSNPFGKYKLPSSEKVYKALTKDELKILLSSTPKTKEQEKAKDFWFFSFYSNGMNINDVVRLKYKNFDFKERKFYFLRNKTKNINRTSLSNIEVYLNEYLLKIIEKYKNEFQDENQYIFPILSDSDDEKIIFTKVKNFIRFINQHIKTLAKDNGLNDKISANWARHSFTTLGINQSLTAEVLKEFLGHANIKTTQKYIGRLDEGNRKKIIDKIYDF